MRTDDCDDCFSSKKKFGGFLWTEGALQFEGAFWSLNMNKTLKAGFLV